MDQIKAAYAQWAGDKSSPEDAFRAGYLYNQDLLRMAFEALLPLANLSIHTEQVTRDDIRDARDAVRFLTEKL